MASDRATLQSGSGQELGTSTNPMIVSMSAGSSLINIDGGATPSVTVFGQMSADNNFWAASHGAPLFYDGTSAVALIGVLGSDTPTDGQVPKWNTGGIITWENDNNTAGITCTDTGILYSNGANNPTCDTTNFNYNNSTHVLTVGSISTATSNTPKLELFPTQTSDTHWVWGVNGDGGNDNDDPLVLSESSTLGTNNRITFIPGGNIGIGSATPGQVLDVQGTVRSSYFSGGFKPRTNTIASSATPAINTDTTDEFTITALAAAITSVTSGLTGTPTNGQALTVRILDNGTARAITWGASFDAKGGVALPTTTVVSKYLRVKFIYNSTTATWNCVAVGQEQ